METERLILREPEERDGELLCEYFRRNGERFARWDPPRPDDVAAHRAWAGAARTSRRGGEPTIFLAFDRATGALAAIVDLHGFSEEGDGSAMLAYTVDAAYEGRGYASEAVASVLEHARTALRLRTISAYVDPANERSLRLLARAGFSLAATTPVVPGFERFMRAQHVAVLTLQT